MVAMDRRQSKFSRLQMRGKICKDGEVTCSPINKKFIGGEIFRRKVKLYLYLFSGV